MKHREVIVLIAVAACSDHASPPPLYIVDAAAPPVACHTTVCNPLFQVGCNAGEKCTWVLGGDCGDHLGCRAAGVTARGGACVHDSAGGDDCARGDVCVDGVCRMICDRQGGEPRCGADETCTEVDAFAFGAQHIAGACLP